MAFHIAKDYCLDNYCVQCFWKCHFNGIWALKDLKGRRDYLAMSSSFNKVSMGFGDDLQESFLQVWCPITVLHPFSENAFPTIFPTVSRSYSHHIPIIFPAFFTPFRGSTRSNRLQDALRRFPGLRVAAIHDVPRLDGRYRDEDGRRNRFFFWIDKALAGILSLDLCGSWWNFGISCQKDVRPV